MDNKTKIQLEDEINTAISDSIENVKKKIKELLIKNNVSSLKLDKVSEHNDGNAYIRITIEKINDYSLLRTNFYFYQEELKIEDINKILSLIKDQNQARRLYNMTINEQLDESDDEIKQIFDKSSDFVSSCEVNEALHFSAICFLNNFHPSDILGFLDFIYGLPEIYLDDYMDT